MTKINGMLNNFYSLSWLDKSIALCVLLFPIVDASFKHLGSIIYIILFLLALRYGWAARKDLIQSEKKIYI